MRFNISAIFTPQYDILDPLTGRSIRDPRTRSKNLALRDNPLLFRPLNNEGVRTQREIPLQRANPKYLLPIGRHRDVSNLASAPVLPKEQRHVNYRRGKSISQLVTEILFIHKFIFCVTTLIYAYVLI